MTCTSHLQCAHKGKSSVRPGNIMLKSRLVAFAGLLYLEKNPLVSHDLDVLNSMEETII